MLAEVVRPPGVRAEEQREAVLAEVVRGGAAFGGVFGGVVGGPPGAFSSCGAAWAIRNDAASA